MFGLHPPVQIIYYNKYIINELHLLIIIVHINVYHHLNPTSVYWHGNFGILAWKFRSLLSSTITIIYFQFVRGVWRKLLGLDLW